MSRRRQAVTVVLFTREQCGLCDEARALIVREARGCTFRSVDIDSDDALLKRYGLRIPVVEVNGQEVAQGGLTKGVMRAAVRAAQRQHAQPRAPRWRFWA